jgi:predicted SAM-dependent methyltransferase
LSGAQPPYKIDLGCGPNKQSGYLGVDHSPWSGVDFIIDIEKQSLPFADSTVTHVFSSHCLEHLKDPERFFREIARVSQDGAAVEIWTPYAFSNGAFIFSHLQFLNEDHYAHMCLLFQDTYKDMTGAFWKWHSITYVINPEARIDIERANIPLDFAIKYYKNIVLEFGVKLSVSKSLKPSISPPRRLVCFERNGPASNLDQYRGGTLPGSISRVARRLAGRLSGRF